MKKAVAWFLTLALLISSLPLEIVAAAEDAAQSAENEEITAASTEETVAATESTEETSGESSIVASGTCGDNLSWSLDTDGLLTISGSGSMATAPWSDYYSDIKAITLEEGVTSICSAAFENCINITDIVIPEGVTYIGYGAFYACNGLVSVTLPESLLEISDRAFRLCTKLVSITIPSKVTEIPDRAFMECYNLKTVVIPEGVTSIGAEAFLDCTGLSSITIPDGVSVIHQNTFTGCASLVSVTLSGNLTTIEAQAFSYCESLEEIVLPESLESIGDSAFYGCNMLKTVSIPSNLTSIGNEAFRSCETLTSVEIPAGVAEIGEMPFANCSNLTGIWVDEANPYYSSDSAGVLFNKDQTMLIQAPGALSGSYQMPNSVISIESGSFYDNALTEIGISENTICIEANAFCRTSLQTVILPASVVTVERNAFSGCTELESVIISDGVAFIDVYAFDSCSNLTEIRFLGDAPLGGGLVFNGVTATAYYPLGNETWTDYMMGRLGGTLTWVTYGAVASGTCGESLTWELTEDGKLFISGTGDMTDYSASTAPWSTNSVVSAVIASGVTSVSSGAFSGCSDLTELRFKGDVPVIGETAFDGVSANAFYPANNTTWTDAALQNYGGTLVWTALLDLPYPEIERDVATTALIPKNGWAYFQFTPEYTETYYICSVAEGYDTYGILYDSGMNILAENDDYSAREFGITYTLEAGETYVLGVRYYSWSNGSFDVILQAQHEYVTEIVTEATCIEDGLKRHTCQICGAVKEEAYSADHSYGSDSVCTVCGFVEGLTGACGSNIVWTLDATGTLTLSGSGAMYDYSWGQAPWYEETIASVVIEEGVTGVGDCAFAGLSEVQSIEIPESVTKIGQSAFSVCEKLTSIEIPSNVTSIGSSAFSGCIGLTAVTVPSTVEEWGEGVFAGCSNLMDVELCEGFTSIAVGMFMYCSALETVTIPDSVTDIGESAFYGCSALETVSIPANVTTIGSGAFAGCSNIDGIWVDVENAVYSSSSEGILFDKALTVLMQAPGTISGEYTIPSTVTELAKSSFNNCAGLTSVIIPEGVTIIGRDAFSGCSALKGIEIPESVTQIGILSFWGCTALTTITIPANVTDIGWCAFDSCTSLNTVTFAGDIPTIGSDAFGGVTATIYYPKGNTTYTEETMLDYGGTLTWVAYENSGVSCAGMSLSLNGDIGVNFYMTLSDEVLADENTRMVLNVGGTAQEMALADALTDTQDDGSIWYRFSCAVPAKSMSDEITAQIYGTDGAVGEVMTYSVAAYYDDICQEFDREEKAELFALIEAMLNYGAASQEYFGYNTESLANASVSTTVPETVDASSFASAVSDTDALLDYAGASLVLESNTVLRVFFRPVTGADISSYAFVVNGETVSPVQRGNLWYIELANIAAKELDTAYTFTAGDVTVECSALSYVNAVLNKADALDEKLVAVCKALYAYNEAANTYFGA